MGKAARVKRERRIRAANTHRFGFRFGEDVGYRREETVRGSSVPQKQARVYPARVLRFGATFVTIVVGNQVLDVKPEELLTSEQLQALLDAQEKQRAEKEAEYLAARAAAVAPAAPTARAPIGAARGIMAGALLGMVGAAASFGGGGRSRR